MGAETVSGDDKAPRVSQVSGNFHRIARDLDCAIGYARLTAVQSYLLTVARRLSWGTSSPDPIAFRFVFHELSRLSKFDRNNLRRAQNAMIERRFFSVVDDGLLINKDYREWRAEDGSPLLDKDQLRDASWYKTRPKTARKTPVDRCAVDSLTDAPLTQGTDDHRCAVDSGGESTAHQKRCAVDSGGESTAHQRHIEERARLKTDLELETLLETPPEIRGRAWEPPRLIAATPDSDGSDKSPYQEMRSKGPNPAPAIPPPKVANDPAEVGDVVRLAEELFPLCGFGAHAGRACREHPARWVREAMEIAAERRAMSWRFVATVLDRFKARGESDADLAKARSATILAIPTARLTPAQQRYAAQRESFRLAAEQERLEAAQEVTDG